MSHSGGVAAAFGFRYQYLVTVELLLDLYEGSSNDWVVDVDPSGQDSADILVYLSGGSSPERVIQVKASLDCSSTTIGIPETRRIFDRLSQDHPSARQYMVVTNRKKTDKLAKELSNQNSELLGARQVFDHNKESLHQLVEKLLHSIGRIRADGPGGTGRELEYLLLRQLVDCVHERGSNTQNQRLTYEDIRTILEGSNPLLANALGRRSWGKCIQVPSGEYIERKECSRFLKKILPARSLYKGKPKIAVIKGMSGTGKTSAAYLHAESLIEHVAFILWLDASSTRALELQIPMVFDELGVTVTPGDNASADLKEVLRELPVPWLLVLDGAKDLTEVKSWIPISGYGQVLLTTSSTSWPKDFAPVMELKAFDKNEARGFMARRLEQEVELWSPEQKVACDTIARKFAGWPLAMEMAAAWIAWHGNSVKAMEQFSERMDRLDLSREDLTPDGYPKTVVQVVLAQWEEFTERAQILASFLLKMGGRHVPGQFLLDSLAELGVTDGELKELLDSGIVQQGISTSGRPHAFDEILTIHDFVPLVMPEQGIPLNHEHLDLFLKASEGLILELYEGGCFREAASLIRPLDSFLENLFKDFEYLVKKSKAKRQVVHELNSRRFHLSILMHNLAIIASITSQPEVAYKWSLEAFRVRRDFPPEPKINDADMAELQLQTIATAATSAARLQNIEGIVNIGCLVYPILKVAHKYHLRDQETKLALNVLRDVLHSFLPDSSPPAARDALMKLNALAPLERLEPVIIGAGDAVINRLHIEKEVALRKVRSGAWQAGVDTVLCAANLAIEEGALIDQMVGGVLGVGLELMYGELMRPMETPALLIDSVKRLVVWLDENSEEMQASQQQRYLILRAFVEDGPGPLSEVVRTLQSVDERTHQVDAWIVLATALAEQRRKYAKFQPLVASLHLLDSFTRSIDGGDHINVWWDINKNSLPELWVHAPNVVTYRNGERIDPVRDGMATAGLREVVQEEQPEIARGWSARLNVDAISIFDANGTSWVSTNDVPVQITRLIYEYGGLLLIYADKPATTTTDPRLAGWIPLDSDHPRPHDGFQDNSVPRWRRFFGRFF